LKIEANLTDKTVSLPFFFRFAAVWGEPQNIEMTNGFGRATAQGHEGDGALNGCRSSTSGGRENARALLARLPLLRNSTRSARKLVVVLKMSPSLVR